MLKLTFGYTIVYQILLIAEKHRNNIYLFINFQVNLYQVICVTIIV